MITATSNLSIVNMSITRGILSAAASSQCTLYTTAAKIVCCTVLPFLLIAAFEALVINSIRTIAHYVTVGKPISPEQPIAQRYRDLVCTETDKAHIKELVTMLGTKNSLYLGFNAPALGSKIEHVHPWKFLVTVFTNPALKQHMATVFDDSWKRAGFMGGYGLSGFGTAMAREKTKGTLDRFAPDFAKEVGAPLNTVQSYTQTSDWEGLVRFLITR